MSTSSVPDYVKAMVRRPVPSDAHVVSGSVPVVSFGNPATCTVATLGINPSSLEFLDKKTRVLLTGADRRLATLDSLGARSTTALTDEQVAEAVADCNSYFHRRPYLSWFAPLDEILQVGLGVSYFEGSAAHLDLVQWATDPVWGNLPDPGVREQLLEEGSEFLRQQLRRENINLVVVNGRQVWDRLKETGLVTILSEDSISYCDRSKSSQVFVGRGCGARFIGWSRNIQNAGDGVRPEDRAEFAKWLRSVDSGATPSPATQVFGPEHLDRTVVRSKSEIVELLRSWLATSDAETIGSVGTFGGKWLIRIQFGGGKSVVLNADTKRAAVEVFLAEVNARGGDIPWRVLPNNRGTWNKVDFLRSGPPVPGWYCYLEQPATGEGTL